MGAVASTKVSREGTASMTLIRRSVGALAFVLLVSGCSSGGGGGGSAPTINGFAASPSSLPVGGGSVTLSWNVSGATSLSIDHGVGAVSPATAGAKVVTVTSSESFTLTASDSTGSVTASASVCTATGPIALSVTGASSYVCQQDYEAVYSIANGSCDPVTVTSVTASAAVTSGACGPPAPASYSPSTAMVAAGATTTVFDLKSTPFCCGSPGCPSVLDCTEDYTFTAVTSAGTLVADAGISIDLGGCSVVCP